MKLVNGRRVGRLSAPELGTVLSLRSDGTVQSALIKASTKKTLTQTYQRLKLPNLGSFHKASKEALRKAFENSVINIFAELVSYNATSEMMPVGITKQQKKAGACVVMPYKITDGSLRPITVDGLISSIVINGLTRSPLPPRSATSLRLSSRTTPANSSTTTSCASSRLSS